MKNKNWILASLAAILLASFVLIAGFSSTASAEKDKPTCCLQKISTPGNPLKGPSGEECKIKTNNPVQDEMMLEKLSRQFLSIPLLAY